MVVIEKNGAYHLKGYSSVSFKDGTPLRKLKADGTPLRVQQTVVLVRKTDEFPSTDHWKVQKLAVARQEKIAEWETRTASAEAVEATPSEDMTVTAFYETEFLPWLDRMVKTGQKSHATLVSYKRYWDTYLSDHFNGTKTLRNYQPYLGQQFIENLRTDDDTHLGENTLRHIHSVASGIFSRAICMGKLGKFDGAPDDKKAVAAINPWHSVKVSDAPKISAEQGKAFTEIEVETMISNLQGDRRGGDRETWTPQQSQNDWNIQLAQCVLAVGIWAGLRPSEIAALQWQSVDLGDATITVQKAYVYGKEKPTTKTGKIRVVPFIDKLSPVLQAWWETNGRPASGWVFPNRDGNPINMNTISDRIIGPNCETHKTPWEGYTFYALRRGFGTLLVLDDWSAEEVSKAMGNSIDVVMRYYFVDKENKLAKAARERSRAKVKVN
jgi:integrase